MTNEKPLSTLSPEKTAEAMNATSPPIPRSWIEKLFEEMSMAYGARFIDQWRGVDPDALKQHWAQKLAGYSVDEIGRGVSLLDTRDWPPTLPEFLKLCRPAIEPQTAHIEACRLYHRWIDGEAVTWSRPEIFWAAHKVGLWDLRDKPYQQLEARWKKALEEASREPVPAPQKQLTAGTGTHDDPEVRRKVAEGLRRLAQTMTRRPQAQLPLRDPDLEMVHRVFEAQVDARDAERSAVRHSMAPELMPKQDGNSA